MQIVRCCNNVYLKKFTKITQYRLDHAYIQVIIYTHVSLNSIGILIHKFITCVVRAF